MQTTTTHTQPLTELLSRLISMPTVSMDRTANIAALDWVAGQLTGLPLTIKRFDNRGYPSLVATTSAVSDEKNPRLWLAAHIDVIPGTVVDFEPKIKDGRLIGRGAFDMKYAIACFIRLCQELGDDLADYNLGIMLTTDEELGGGNGVEWLIKDQGYRGDAVLLPECGTSWTIEIGSKGLMGWKLSSHGLASHGSRPWNGVNAIDQIIRFVDQLKTHVPAEPCGDEHHNHSTVNLGQISGGVVANQVPEFAQALVDVRLKPGISLDEANEWFASAARTVPGVEAELYCGNAATHEPLVGPLKLFKDIALDITGIQLVPMIAHGSSDGRFFMAHHIPVISVPPTGGGQHGDHEWIDVKSLEQYYEIVRRFTNRWAGPVQKS